VNDPEEYPCHCGGGAEGHGHLSMPDPPGTTRLELIRRYLGGEAETEQVEGEG
jgi:hypothetical protein